jgi:hypothetical protein
MSDDPIRQAALKHVRRTRRAQGLPPRPGRDAIERIAEILRAEPVKRRAEREAQGVLAVEAELRERNHTDAIADWPVIDQRQGRGGTR